MQNQSNINACKVRHCLVSIGSSPDFYISRFIPNHGGDSVSICNCSRKEEISGINLADHYDIIISSSDESVKDIIYDLFSYLIPRDASIRVIFVLDGDTPNKNLPKHVAFLEKLEKHKFIVLEFVNDCNPEQVRQEENIIFFVGPGNTGKTSIISSLTEHFRQNDQKLALVDITRKNKLINYFPNHSFLNSGNLKDFTVFKDFYKSANVYSDGLADLYVYDYEYDGKGPEVIYFCEILRKLSELYDYIIVNADEGSVMNTPYILKTASRIFIVHDFMPTKIKITKKLLLKMLSSGIDTQKTVSLIYNKTLNDTIDICTIEEKLLFVRLPNKRILPTININCNTFEIPYEQKTMNAIIRNLALKTTGIENTSKKYKNNILNIYRHINGIPYTDNDEMEISQFFRGKVRYFVDGKYLEDAIKSIKSGLKIIKNSRVGIKCSNLLNSSKIRLKDAEFSIKSNFTKCTGYLNNLTTSGKYFGKQ